MACCCAKDCKCDHSTAFGDTLTLTIMDWEPMTVCSRFTPLCAAIDSLGEADPSICDLLTVASWKMTGVDLNKTLCLEKQPNGFGGCVWAATTSGTMTAYLGTKNCDYGTVFCTKVGVVVWVQQISDGPHAKFVLGAGFGTLPFPNVLGIPQVEQCVEQAGHEDGSICATNAVPIAGLINCDLVTLECGGSATFGPNKSVWYACQISDQFGNVVVEPAGGNVFGDSFSAVLSDTPCL